MTISGRPSVAICLVLFTIFSLSSASSNACGKQCSKKRALCAKSCKKLPGSLQNACLAMCKVKEGTCLYDCSGGPVKGAKRAIPKTKTGPRCVREESTGKCRVPKSRRGRKPHRGVKPAPKVVLSASDPSDNGECKAECTTWYNYCTEFCGIYVSGPDYQPSQNSPGHSCMGTCDLFDEQCEFHSDYDENTVCIPWRNDCYDYCPADLSDIPGQDCETCDYYVQNCQDDCDATFPTPTPIPCNEESHDGGSDGGTFTVQMGATSGTFDIDYYLGTIPDSIDCDYEGTNIFSTHGLYANTQYETSTVTYGPGTSTEITCTVVGNNNSQTHWYITVHCPN